MFPFFISSGKMTVIPYIFNLPKAPHNNRANRVGKPKPYRQHQPARWLGIPTNSQTWVGRSQPPTKLTWCQQQCREVFWGLESPPNYHRCSWPEGHMSQGHNAHKANLRMAKTQYSFADSKSQVRESRMAGAVWALRTLKFKWPKFSYRAEPTLRRNCWK